MIILGIFLMNRSQQKLSSCSIFIFLLSEVCFNVYSTIILLINAFNERNQSFVWITNWPVMFAAKLFYVFALCFLFFIECFSDNDALKRKPRLNEHFRIKVMVSTYCQNFISFVFINRTTLIWNYRLPFSLS